MPLSGNPTLQAESEAKDLSDRKTSHRRRLVGRFARTIRPLREVTRRQVIPQRLQDHNDLGGTRAPL
jgi:hypothetical protein